MTTMAATVQEIRRILNDRPEKIQLASALSTTTDQSVYVTDADFGKLGIGNILEHDDGASGAELRRVISTNSTAVSCEAERGYFGSTATTHADESYLLKDPRFYYDTIAQAVGTVLVSDLYNDGVVDLNEHQITSSATTVAYAAPTSSCQEFLSIYQKTSSMTEPEEIKNFTRLPQNIDTDLYATGKLFFIRSNFGSAGTDLYYVTCAHRHTITSLTAQAEKIVQWLACAYLLEWTGPRRVAGPTNQGDRTVRPGQEIATAAYFRQLAVAAIAKERSEMRRLNPAQRIFRRA